MTAHVAPAGGATRAARSVARWFRDLRCAPTENGHGLASTPKAVTGNELVFPLPGGPATTIIRARITQRHPVSSVVSESGNISGGSSLDTSLPSASTIPKRSKRARALASRAAPSSARRRRHSTRSSSRSRSRSSKRASGIGAELADAGTESACPTWTRPAKPSAKSSEVAVQSGVERREKGPEISGASRGCAGAQLHAVYRVYVGFERRLVA